MSEFFSSFFNLFQESNFGQFLSSLVSYLPSWFVSYLVLSIVIIFVGSLIKVLRG